MDAAEVFQRAAKISGCDMAAIEFFIVEMDESGQKSGSAFTLALALHEHRYGTTGHVSAKTICEAAAKLAKKRYGMLARDVLSRIGIESCKDLGKITFALIDVGLLKAGPGDSMEEFDGAIDWDGALDYAEDLKTVEIDTYL